MDSFALVFNLADAGLKAMCQNGQHHFDWRTRREIYRTLKQIDPIRGEKVHSWLSFLSAQHALPIFTTAFPEDDLPVRLLARCEKILAGKVSPQSQQVAMLLDEGYHATGIDNFTWRRQKRYDAEYAGTACYHALLEVSGKQILLDKIEKEGGYTQTFRWHVDTKHPVTDAQIAHLAAFSDTAAPAVIAFACHPEEFTLDKEKMRLFWEWWGREALPTALERGFR